MSETEQVCVRMLYAVRVPKPGGAFREYPAGDEFFVPTDDALSWVDAGAAVFVGAGPDDPITVFPDDPEEPNPFEDVPVIPAPRELED